MKNNPPYHVRVDLGLFYMTTIQNLDSRTFSKLKDLLYNQPITDDTNQEIYRVTGQYRRALLNSLKIYSPRYHDKFEELYSELYQIMIKLTTAVDQFRLDIEILSGTKLLKI